jgi:hypothetical protein
MPAMPAQEPLRNVNEVLRIESQLRMGTGATEVDIGRLPPYWADLARLLVAFRMYKNRDRDGMVKVAQEFHWPLYQPYVLGKAATL